MNNKQLPDGLKDELNNMRNGVKQWSQFVAWSWTDYLAFQDDEEKNKQEQTLKQYFRKILQDQARYQYAVDSYGDEEKKQDAYTASLRVKKLVMGKNSEIDDDDFKDIIVTLPEVYEKLTNKKPESLCSEALMKLFHVQIVTDSFSGYVRDASEEEKAEIKDFIDDQDVQYIIYLAYPPCPALGKATVTEEQLTYWMQDKNEFGESSTDYLPPSAYIPVSMT